MDTGVITYIDTANIENKRVLLRVDFNVAMSETSEIADDVRIRQSLPTIQELLKKHNKIILIAHLDRPKGRDPKLTLAPVAKHLQTLLPGYTVKLVDDFTTPEGKKEVDAQTDHEIVMLENIRFYKEEKPSKDVPPEEKEKMQDEFAQKLASLADVYVNDAFGVSHRSETSVVAITKFLPSYGGLLLKKETETITKLLKNPEKPFVAIIGGAKVSTKLQLLSKLIDIADVLIVGGGIANTFLLAQGYSIGKSLAEREQLEAAQKILMLAGQKDTKVVVPSDVVVGDSANAENGSKVYRYDQVPDDKAIFDIGPETQARIGNILNKANTIVWNGPVGYMENPQFARGTDFIYYAMAHNDHALTVVGGGDTLAAINKKEYLDKIAHISTGGGAMLEFIEKGTLPGIEALKGRG